MQGARWWLVCYDVRESQAVCGRTARHMEGYGERVQYSVFRCWLTPRRMEQLQAGARRRSSKAKTTFC